MTTIYLVRHAKPLSVNNKHSKDDLQLQNEKRILSVEGEQQASILFNNNEFDNIEVVYSSNYVRAISSAKYIANRNKLDINIVDELGERKFGVSSWDELDSDFEKKQFYDEDYKIGNGESQKEVRDRMYNTLLKILNNNKSKNVIVVSHATAITYLLKKWCNVEIVDNKFMYSYNNNVLLHRGLNYCEVFKLEFDDNGSLVDINNLVF